MSRLYLNCLKNMYFIISIQTIVKEVLFSIRLNKILNDKPQRKRCISD